MVQRTVNETSLAGFLAAISEIQPVTHPPGRATKKDRELWILQRAISAIVGNRGKANWKLKHQDKPDFLLQVDNRQIGIEITVAITESHAQYLSLGERGSYAPMVFWHHQKATHRDIVRKMGRQSFSGSGISGNEIEVLLAEKFRQCVSSKSQKMESGAISRFAENHLVIYDQGSPAGTDVDEAIALCNNNVTLRSLPFDAVWVVGGRQTRRLDH